GGDGGQARYIQLVPGARAQALVEEEDEHAVDAPQHPVGPGLAEHPGPLLEVAELGEDLRDPDEDGGDEARAALDLAAQLIRLALQTPPALGPAGVGLPFVAGVARMPF